MLDGNSKKFLTTKQVADILEVNQNLVYIWRKRGDGPPFYKICGQVKYDREEFERWLKSNHHNNGGGQPSCSN